MRWHDVSLGNADGMVTLSDGHRHQADLLLWGTGYGVDLSYFESPDYASIRTRDALGVTLVSNNTREFGRVPALKVGNRAT